MRIIFALHARTEWNLEGKLQGQTDIPLNKEGMKEAVALVELLKVKGSGITHIITSTLKRALGTALIIGTKLRVPLHHEARLRECHFGKLEGLAKEDLGRHYPRTLLNSPEGPWHGSYAEYDFSAFGGETRDQVLARHLAVLRGLRKEEVPLLVGHGCGLNTLLSELGEHTPLKRGEVREIEFRKE